MGKKDGPVKKVERVEAVLQQLRKQSPPLTVKQDKFCTESCIERFLKAKDYNPKKAAKQLRACLSWRQSIGIENLIADEFSAELAEGVAYVAGHDEESRPVTIFRIKQDYHKFHSRKLLNRLIVFTLEVAIGTMPKNVDQLVLLIDASLFSSASAFINMWMAILKIMWDYYPGRLHQAFVIDPPSIFSYLWKGVRPFVELSSVTFVVFSLDFQDALEFKDLERASSLRFDPSPMKPTAKVGSCSSSRFSFSVSHHFDSLKPWYLTLTDTTPISLGPALMSPLNARSLSFVSPAARGGSYNAVNPSTPLPQRVAARGNDNASARWPRTPGPCFFRSQAAFFRARRGYHVKSRSEWCRELFVPLVKFYRRPYDEMAYRRRCGGTWGFDLHGLTPNEASTRVGMPTVLDKTKSDRGKSVHRTESILH